MSNKNIDEIVQKIEQLPSLPIISEKMQKLLFNSDDVSIKQIGNVIESDPPLAVKILKIVNSSFYGMLNNVSTIEHALVILGINEFKNVILGFSIQKYFVNSNKNFDPKRFWKHSVICSQIAKFLSKHFKIIDDGTYFLAGLTHDIGKLVIDQYFHKDFIAITNYITTNKTTFSSAEKEIMGVTHYQIAAKLLQKWNFPKKIIMQIFYHHAPWYDKEFTQGSIIIYLSNILTKIAGFTCFEHEKAISPNNCMTSSVFDFINKNGFEIDQESFEKLQENINEFLSSEANDVLKIFD